MRKNEDSERPDWAWPWPCLRDRSRQSNTAKHRPACKAAPQHIFMKYRSHFHSYPEKLCRMKLMAPPHPFQTLPRNEKTQVKSHSAVKQQESFLITGKTTPFTLRLHQRRTTEIWEERSQQHFVLQGCSKHSSDE